MKSNKKTLNPKQKRSMWTFFTLLFPSLLMALFITFERSTISIIAGILLFFYQSVLLKDCVEKHYNPSA